MATVTRKDDLSNSNVGVMSATEAPVDTSAELDAKAEEEPTAPVIKSFTLSEVKVEKKVVSKPVEDEPEVEAKANETPSEKNKREEENKKIRERNREKHKNAVKEGEKAGKKFVKTSRVDEKGKIVREEVEQSEVVELLSNGSYVKFSNNDGEFIGRVYGVDLKKKLDEKTGLEVDDPSWPLFVHVRYIDNNSELETTVVPVAVVSSISLTFTPTESSPSPKTETK